MDLYDQLIELDPADVVEGYDRLDLTEVSDATLVDAAAAIIARGQEGAPDSFLLHAPLELIARAALLPHVAPADRTTARRRIVSMTAKHAREAGERPRLRTTPTDDPAGTAARLAEALAAGELVALTAEVVVARLSAAGHGAILL